MKILITGAAGFLGSHLTKEALDQGHQVLGLDDFSTGSRQNIERLSSRPGFEFLEHDVRTYQLDPVRTIETNFLGIINMLHLAKQTGAKILQASTSEVYGDPTISPQPETYWGNVNPIGIRSCYDEGKRAAETLCFDYKRQYGIDARVIRIFNTYGPNMAVGDGRVVSNFIVQALQGKPITIYGDGSQTRSFCYVSDLIDGILKVLALTDNPHTPINLGNPAEFSMLQLASKVIEITKSKSTLVFEPLPLDDPRQRRPDISQAKSLLGWEPKVSLGSGIEMTAEYFKSELLA